MHEYLTLAFALKDSYVSVFFIAPEILLSLVSDALACRLCIIFSKEKLVCPRVLFLFD